jgi:uncharacterized membrane protein
VQKLIDAYRDELQTATQAAHKTTAEALALLAKGFVDASAVIEKSTADFDAAVLEAEVKFAAAVSIKIKDFNGELTPVEDTKKPVHLPGTPQDQTQSVV